MMQKYRKKPVIIEAIKWTGNNYEEVRDFTNNKVMYYQWFQYNESGINEKLLTIETLEGKMEASIGDFIIKGVKGEFYPCKPDIFEMTYESI